MANSGGTGILWLVVIAAAGMLYAQCQAETKVVCNSQSWLYGNQPMTWHQAYAQCKRRSSYYLAAPTNSQDLACISQFPATSGQHRWIGINDIGLEGYFTFVHNRRRAHPLAWAQDEPDNFGNFEDCVILRWYDKRYSDVHCNGQFGYICQSAVVDGAWGSWQAWSQCSASCGCQGFRSRIRPCNNPSPTNGGHACTGRSQQTQDCRVACPGQWCPAGWHTGCKKCYKFAPGGLRYYQEAKTACEQQIPGSRLLAILSENEQIDVMSFLSRREHYWVWNDITDQQREGVWVHGQTPINYTNWNRGEPNGGRRENCASFREYLHEFWMDTPCRYRTGLQVLCEKDLADRNVFSNWGVWSSCSATCGQGTRSRRRLCMRGEVHCLGNVEDSQMCPLPNCPPVPCRKLSAPAHGSMSPDERQDSSFHFGMVKTFSCNRGYYLQSISSQSRTCQATGQWTGDDAECLPVSCGEPAKADGMQSVVTGTVFRSQQAISCREGFRMIGDQPLVVRTCSWDKLWTPSALPECQVITCPVLTAARPLLVQHTGVVYSSTATYSCTPGYRLLPADGGVRKCVADCPVKTRDWFRFNDCSAGRWSGRAPLCSPVPCPPLRSPPNGIMTSKPREEKLFHFGITKAFTCKLGYNLRSSSSSSRHCQANGVWSGAQAECLPVECGPPELMEHGWQIITKTTSPGVQVIGCKSPYYFPREERFLSRSCTAEGIWSPAELPVCRGLVCREPSSTPNLITTKTKPKHYNDTIQTATHSCPAGFAISLSGHRSRFCRAQCIKRFIRLSRHSVCEPGNTLWEGTPPNCSRIPCRAIRAPVNGVIKSTSIEDSVLSEERQVVDDSVFETTLTCGCNTGYQLLNTGSNQQRCDASGQWVGPAQVCVPAGVWSAWGNWGQCSVLCGCGRKLRQRQCTGETGGPREGVNCSGSSTEGVPCLTKPCKGQLCPAGWIAGCLKCYQVSYFPLHTHRQAQSHCERQTHGSRLLVVASQEDHTDFGAFVLWRHVHTWMDISEFTNSTGDNSSTSKFQNWQVEGRNGPPSSCAVIGNAGDGIWTQEPCGAQYQAVCERGLATAGGYGEWGEWEQCSVTCGEGVRTRRRQCNHPEPSFEGANCTGVGQESGPCPVDACPRANCGRPDLMSNGWQVLTGTLAGDSQTLGCQVPFVLTGVPGRHTIRRCTTNGTWTPESLPSCKVLDCGNPSSSPSLLTEYQTLDNTSSTLAEVVHSCPDGFTISSHGDRRRTCKEFCPRRFVSGHFRQLCHGSDTRWSGTAPLCTPLNCERLTTPINGKMISNPGQEDLFHVGINKTFSCNAGYRLGSTASGPRECLANRTWSGQSAQCTRELACPRPICEFQVGLCSLDQNRPVEACSVEAKINSDLGIVARVKRDTQPSCIDNDDKYIVTLRVREELYKNSDRCGFLPGITGAGSAGRYDIAMELTFEEGCPCPVPESGVTYLITAKCDPSRGRIVSHPHSLFQRQTTRGRKNLLRRCQWA